MIQIDTTRFGKLEVSEDKVIHFPNGLMGFPDTKKFILMDYKDTLLKWLQATEDPDIAFIVLHPFDFFPEYTIKIAPQVKDFLGIDDEKSLLSLAIARVENNNVLVNLQGPLLVNPDTKNGIQVVNEDTRYTCRTPLTPISASVK
jgi:flagellar assembly factor FliW